MTLAERVIVMNKGIAEQIGPPTEIYRRPASLFVASFIGSPAMNLWAGRISDEGTQFMLSAECAIPLPVAKPEWRGRALTLGVRPEHIQLTTREAGGIPLLLTTLELLGADNLAHGVWGEQSVVVRLSHEQCPARGDTLWLALPPPAWHFFDTESGLRVE